MSRAVTTATVAVALLLLGHLAGAAALRSPVDLARQQKLFHLKPQNFVCPEVRTVASRVQSVVIYSDQKGSIVDPERERQNRALLADVIAEEDALSRSVTQLVGSDAAHQAPMAACILAHLRDLATADAFIASDDIRGTGAVRLTAVTPILAYLVLRDGAPIPAADEEAIRAWIGRLAERLQHWQVLWPYRNNIDDWTEAALGLAGVALGRGELLDHAIGIAARESDNVTVAGTLPLEDNRGKQAVGYNLFAAQAIGLIVATARANGRDLLAEPATAGLPRLMRTLTRAIAHPESFPVTVPLPKVLDRSNMGWLLLYYRATRDSTAVAEICARRPLYSWRAGGDWIVLFGNPKLCPRGKS